MREVISNTSPLQYLHQLDLLDVLPTLYGEVLVPAGVAREIAGVTKTLALLAAALLAGVRSHLCHLCDSLSNNLGSRGLSVHRIRLPPIDET